MYRSMIRVELHNARTAAQYTRLHALLAGFGIVTEIPSNNGRRYKLPPAEYFYTGYLTQDRVLAIAKQCAAQVDNSYSVVVTETTGVIAWDGLKEVA